MKKFKRHSHFIKPSAEQRYLFPFVCFTTKVSGSQFMKPMARSLNIQRAWLKPEYSPKGSVCAEGTSSSQFRSSNRQSLRTQALDIVRRVVNSVAIPMGALLHVAGQFTDGIATCAYRQSPRLQLLVRLLRHQHHALRLVMGQCQRLEEALNANRPSAPGACAFACHTCRCTTTQLRAATRPHCSYTEQRHRQRHDAPLGKRWNRRRGDGSGHKRGPYS